MELRRVQTADAEYSSSLSSAEDETVEEPEVDPEASYQEESAETDDEDPEYVERPSKRRRV
jgi:hypothetical protein